MASKRKTSYTDRIKSIKEASKNMGSLNVSNNMDNSISNYKTRIASTGADISQATDNRNFIEKALNLPEDQNALFDIFEIIGRPQQALFRGIESVQEGDSFLEGVKEGLTGEETTNFGDILRNAGVSDKELFTNPITKESTSLADMLGLVGDIALDPVDLALFAATPVTGGASTGALVAKEGVDTALDTARYTYKFNPIKALTQSNSKSLLDMAAGGAANLAKKAVGGVTSGVAKASDISNISKLAKNAGLIQNGVKVTDDMIPTLTKQLADLGITFNSKTDALNSVKKAFNRTVDYSKSFEDDLFNKISRSDNILDTVNAYGKKIKSSIDNDIRKYADSTGKNFDDVQKHIQNLISSEYAPEIGMDYYVKTALKNGGKSDIIKGTKDELNSIKKGIENFVNSNKNISNNAIRVNIKNGGLTIEGNTKLLGAIHDNDDLMKQLSNVKFRKIQDLDEDIVKEVRQLKKIYKNDTEFNNILKNAKSSYKQVNDYLKSLTDDSVDFGEMLRNGYVTKGLLPEGNDALNLLKDEKIGTKFSNRVDDEIYKGSSKTFGERTYSNNPTMANRQFQEDIKNTITSKENQIENLKNQMYEAKKANLEGKLSEIDAKRTELKSNFEKNLKEANIKGEKARDLAKKYGEKLDELPDLISDRVIEKAQKIVNQDLTSSLLKKSDKYNNTLRKLDDLTMKLGENGLTSKQVKKLTEQYEKTYEKLIKTKSDIVFQTAKIEGAVEESFIKEAGKIANDMANSAESLATKKTKQLGKEVEQLNVEKQLKESYHSVISDLDKTQADLRLQLNNLISMSDEEIATSNKFVTDKISEVQKSIDIFKSVEGTQLFSEMFNEGFDAFINKTTSQAKAMKNYNEVLLNSGLNNPNVVKFVKTGEDTTDLVKKGMVEIDVNFKKQVLKYIDDMKNFMPKNNKLLKQFKRELSTSKAAYIDKNLKELLEVNSKLNTNEAKALVETFDKVNNLFKKTSTLSLGFHLRNVTGNASNMWLSGMSAKDISLSYAKATKLSKSDYMIDLITKNAKGTLTKSEAADYKVIQNFIKSGALGNSKDIRDLGELIEKATTNNESKNIAKKAWDGLFAINAKANQKMDNLSRMALLSHATKNSSYVAKLGANDAIDAMKQVLFDPQNLSPFEKKYLKKIIPFYTFTKQNLMFQMKNVMNNTSRYNKLIKTFNKMYEGVGEDNYRQYQKENFEIPIVTDDDTLSIKSNLPLGDLGDYVSNPLQRLVSSTNPLIKAPFEQVTGVDTFTGQDISDRSPLQAILDTTGLSNLTTDPYENLKSLYDMYDNEYLNTPDALSQTLPSIFRYTDPEKVANQNQYEELMQYQNFVKQLKNQGIDVPSIRELSNNTNSSIKAIKKARQRYEKRRYN